MMIIDYDSDYGDDNDSVIMVIMAMLHNRNQISNYRYTSQTPNVLSKQK